ncbi:type ISP restriction/modification enzyme [Anaerobaca lacustris]|uniref:site-specific DNA-methyltransferase (adenine-specific) n=1 Tax=Anaerobaca lacustris TaxID=3044600 RepID=A0AAW6U3E3_9BACT|nr:N-6 DNA methylase [Sedimentisphaerales bacterium M17dextr]
MRGKIAVDPVESYLKDVSEIWRSGGGVAEESYYGAMQKLLDEIGSKLKPRVRCVGQLKNTGAGTPDFGLFTADQFQRAKDTLPIEGQLPSRGVIECKPWDDDSFARSESAQVSKYWKRYNLVLVTNYRDFVLIGRDEAGKALRLESFRLAESENAFHAMLAHPHKTAREHGPRLVEFLRRVMLHAAPLTEPEDLAWFLASYAREARFRVEEKAHLPALEGLKKALEEALGMKFEGDKGEHFFRATLVQTLFYGVFSSWVLWSREHRDRPGYKFRWHDTAWTLHVPMIATLFDQIAMPKRLKPLGIDEVLDCAGVVLNRVDRAAFFSRFEDEHAVQYFYEPFLKAYDPELRKDLGVWYTPPEIVQYQVERVERVLREELNIADGLADEQVVILDPCCGTGAYLVETLKRIHKTLQDKGRSALTAQRLKKAAMERVFGFEILPAPFVISHLQLGLLLRQLDAPLNPDGSERAGVYLTNALTGWEPLEDPKTLLPFPELKAERDKANEIKQQARILVILGNPPYNGFAGTAIQEERDLVTSYRTTKRAPKPEGQGLNDLYIRFFRMAERRIVEKTGKGVICYISNYSWLEGLSHTGMRERYLEAFDRIWIDCLNGDKYKTGKLTPWGEPDPSIFSTEQNREGIQVGTAIALLVLSTPKAPDEEVHCRTLSFRHLWGKGKHAEIQRNAREEEQAEYETLSPQVSVGYPYSPIRIDQDYMTWPSLPDVFPVSFPGVQTCRDEFLVDIDRERLNERIDTYFNRELSHDEIMRQYPVVMQEGRRYTARQTRDVLLRRGRLTDGIVRYAYRPFDMRWLYWEPETKLLDEKRVDYFPHVYRGNVWLAGAQHHRRDYDPPLATASLGCRHLYEYGANLFPIYLKVIAGTDDLFSQNSGTTRANLSPCARAYLDSLSASADDLFFECLATFFSGAYVADNGFALRQGWPRVPLPGMKAALLASAALGRRIAALLDTEKPVDGVTTGQIDSRLRDIGAICRVGGGSLDPHAGHLDVMAGWGHAGKGGVCMPGSGKVEVRGQDDEALRRAFGDGILDVFLNEHAYWSNVPRAVWEYRIGGYQVVKKWLSYREKALLGRGLKVEEAEYVTEMVRRIAALILMQRELDANYEAVKADTYPWPHSEQ